jgi:hypothetical protein
VSLSASEAYCAIDDATCPTTGRRWDSSAASSLARRCVDAVPPRTPAFGPLQPLPPTGKPCAKIVTADLDGNGGVDLACALQHRDDLLGVGVWLNDGHGAFAAPVRYESGYGSTDLVAGDFDRDGVLDLAVANFEADPQGAYTASVLRGVGGGLFAAPIYHPLPGRAAGIGSGDVDGDGNADLAVADNLQGVTLLTGSPSGLFTQGPSWLTSLSPVSLVVARLDDDSRDDVAVVLDVDMQLQLFYGAELPNPPPHRYKVGAFPGGVAAADLNHDGRPDLVVTNRMSDNVSVLLTANQTLQIATPYAVGSYPFPIVIADLNGDGAPDVVVGNQGGSTLTALLNRGDGVLDTVALLPAPGVPAALGAADLDGDGRIDLVIATSDGQVAVLPSSTP